MRSEFRCGGGAIAMLTCYDTVYEIPRCRPLRLLRPSVSFSYVVLRRCWRAANGLRRPVLPRQSMPVFPWQSHDHASRPKAVASHLTSMSIYGTVKEKTQKLTRPHKTSVDGRSLSRFCRLRSSSWHTEAPFEHTLPYKRIDT